MTATALPSQQTATRSRGGAFGNVLGKLKKLFFPMAPAYLFTTNFNVAFASYLMALLPTLVVFLVAQRWVVSGIMRGSIK